MSESSSDKYPNKSKNSSSTEESTQDETEEITDSNSSSRISTRSHYIYKVNPQEVPNVLERGEKTELTVQPLKIFVAPRLTSSDSKIELKTVTNNVEFLKIPIGKDNNNNNNNNACGLMDNELNRLVSVPSMVCRICHTNTVNEKLLSPCYCKGSLAYVHLSCLERWLNQSSRSYCELCLYRYNAVETLRYTFFESVRLWIRHPRNRNHVKFDCVIAILLTLVTFGLIMVCVVGMDYFVVEGLKLGFSRTWTKSFIVSFLSVILLGYSVTIYLIVKDQFVPWHTWWRNTLNIRLLLGPNVPQPQPPTN